MALICTCILGSISNMNVVSRDDASGAIAQADLTVFGLIWLLTDSLNNQARLRMQTREGKQEEYNELGPLWN